MFYSNFNKLNVGLLTQNVLDFKVRIVHIVLEAFTVVQAIRLNEFEHFMVGHWFRLASNIILNSDVNTKVYFELGERVMVLVAD